MAENDNVTITLTRKEAERLCTLLGLLNGMLQSQGITNPNIHNRYFRFWHSVYSKTARSLGFQAYSVPSKYVDAILDAAQGPQNAL